MQQLSDAKLERLSTALDAYNRARVGVEGGALQSGAVLALISTQNRLYDACVGCGMPFDGEEEAFAAAAVTRWLVEA